MRLLGLDERYKLLAQHHSIDNAATRVAIAKLINEAWFPVMIKLNQIVDGLTPDEIKATAAGVGDEVDLVGTPRDSASMRGTLDDARGKGFHFDGAYEFIIYLQENGFGTPLAYNSGQDEIAREIGLALGTFVRILDDHREALQSEMSESAREVLGTHSFTNVLVEDGLLFATATLAHALSQMVVAAAAEDNPGEFVRRCTEARDHLSIIEEMALKYPPAVLGPYGEMNFLENAIEVDSNGVPNLTARFNEFVHSAHFASRLRTDRRPELDLGQGCPVAFPALEGKRTGVGLFVESFRKIWDVLAHPD